MTHHKVRHIRQRHIKQKFKHFYFLIAGVLAAGLGLKGFLIPNNFIDGGVTGISMLISHLTNIPLWILIFVINIPFVILGYGHISRSFALKTFLGIAGLAACLIVIPYPVVTSDKLLISVFGGFFLGLGIGLCLRGGGVIDGTEVLSLYLGRKTGLSIGDIILVINIFIFSFAAVALSLEAAFYSMLTYLSASKTVDFITYGFEEYIGVLIISDKFEEIRTLIIEKMGKGATILKGQRGFGRINGKLGELNIVYTITTKLEANSLKNKIDKIDKKAFLILQSIHDVKGGMIKRRPVH